MTFENDTFESYKDARRAIIGTGDTYRYYNPRTGRPVKMLMNYPEIVLYSENDHLGYKGMVFLKKVRKGEVIALREIFDQNGENKFNDMWESLMIDIRR